MPNLSCSVRLSVEWLFAFAFEFAFELLPCPRSFPRSFPLLRPGAPPPLPRPGAPACPLRRECAFLFPSRSQSFVSRGRSRSLPPCPRSRSRLFRSRSRGLSRSRSRLGGVAPCPSAPSTSIFITAFVCRPRSRACSPRGPFALPPPPWWCPCGF